jgi:hypothetical protein
MLSEPLISMEIPKPPEIGSAGNQQPEVSDLTPIEPYAPLMGLPLAQRVEGLAATKPRNLGGEVAATLIAGSFTQMSTDLQLQREQASSATEHANRLQQEFATSSARVAVLEERLAAYERTQTIKHIAIFAGTALLAVAIDLFKAELKALGSIVALLGAALLVFGWITRQRGDQK